MQRRNQFEYEEQFRGGRSTHGQYFRGEEFSRYQEYFDDADRYYRQQLRILWNHRYDVNIGYYQQQARQAQNLLYSCYEDDRCVRRPTRMDRRPFHDFQDGDRFIRPPTQTTHQPMDDPYNNDPTQTHFYPYQQANLHKKTYPTQAKPKPNRQSNTHHNTFPSQVNPYPYRPTNPHRNDKPIQTIPPQSATKPPPRLVEGDERLKGRSARVPPVRQVDGVKQGFFQTQDLQKSITIGVDSKAGADDNRIQLQKESVEVWLKEEALGEGAQADVEKAQEVLVEAQREKARNELVGGLNRVKDTGRQKQLRALPDWRIAGCPPWAASLLTTRPTPLASQAWSTAPGRLPAADVADRKSSDPPIVRFTSTGIGDSPKMLQNRVTITTKERVTADQADGTKRMVIGVGPTTLRTSKQINTQPVHHASGSMSTTVGEIHLLFRLAIDGPTTEVSNNRPCKKVTTAPTKAITPILRKVTVDMKTKKCDQWTGVDVATGKGGRSASYSKVEPSNLEFQRGQKWVVENQIGKKKIVGDYCGSKLSVYLLGCKDFVLGIQGKDPTFSMGKEIPVAVVFQKLHMLYEYCKQQFAQREGLAMTLEVSIGKRGNITEDDLENASPVILPNPVLIEGEFESLLKDFLISLLKQQVMSTIFDIRKGIANSFETATKVVQSGLQLLVLISDRFDEPEPTQPELPILLTVPVAELEGKTVDLYFSFTSYKSSTEFTPKLVEVYEKLKEKGEGFEKWGIDKGFYFLGDMNRRYDFTQFRLILYENEKPKEILRKLGGAVADLVTLTEGLVNCVVEKKCKRTEASIAGAANTIGIPQKLNDVRHEGYGHYRQLRSFFGSEDILACSIGFDDATIEESFYWLGFDDATIEALLEEKGQVAAVSHTNFAVTVGVLLWNCFGFVLAVVILSEMRRSLERNFIRASFYWLPP